MSVTCFVAGTDTDAGKTLITAGLLVAANRKGHRTQAMKPLASGSVVTEDGLRNDDALLLQSRSSVELSYRQVNPLAFEPAIAPHIAARQAGQRLDAGRLVGFCRGVMLGSADLTLIEGVGGWRVPLNERETVADMVRELQIPVVLVVAMRLGCINHAILSAEAIRRDGLVLAGWVANCVVPHMDCLDDNLATLDRWLAAPCLGVVPWQDSPSPELTADFLRVDLLLRDESGALQ